ncbi:SDR family oxidoreductase [Halovivax sp.]|uniref:SDR family oxidoreductase n=1 Tax=Halovivax sp. TaxID=1935978 RepID=UPI0025B97671|nr:SDR family oxidoreductase [Halovivax sp.]
MADRSLSDDVAVVTGASTGIGAATARELASRGADIVLAARSEQRLDALAEEIEREYGTTALAVPTDVRERDQVETLIEAAVEELGGVDTLVNNAGLARGSDVETMTDDEYRTMMETNVDGVFYATRAALSHLRAASGHLVFVGSFAGQYPRPFNPVYAASKWWVRGFALSVAAAAGDDDVAVTVVNPSEVRTAFGSEYGEPFADRFDPGEVTEPEEVAEAIAFAVTREGSTVSELDVYRRDKLTFF